MARFAPASDSMVRAISAGRAGVSTSIVTSSGMCPFSMRVRTKLKSVCDAAGKATSISLKPILQSILNMPSLRSASIGSKRAWLPSRRSVLIQTGALERVLSGHVRSARRTGGKGRYLPVVFIFESFTRECGSVAAV